MKTGEYRKTVMKAVNTKSAKLGLKVMARSTSKTVIATGVIGLNSEIGLLLIALHPYILGETFNPAIKKAAITPFANIGFHLMPLSRILKLKIPAATKKKKLGGTRTKALLELDELATEMLQLVQRNLDGPKMHEVEKLIVLPKEGGKKELRKVKTVDLDAEKVAEEQRNHILKGFVLQAIDLYWALCFDIFQTTPSVIFDASAKHLGKEKKTA